MEPGIWADLIAQVGVGGILAWLLVQGASKFLDDQRDRDEKRYDEMKEREKLWFELVRSNSEQMSTNNELLRTQNHLLRNVVTRLQLDADERVINKRDSTKT